MVSIPSTASFYYNLWLTGDEQADKLTVGQEVLDVFAKGTEHTLATREHCESQFFDAWHDVCSKT